MKANEIKVSVVMPVYNAEKYLRECLDSVLAQTMRDFEVIGVDDGSTDGSLAILDEYAKRDARIQVIRCDHTNAGHCRNVGIAQSHGEYLMFLDADDVFAPEMLETMLDAAMKANAEVAICGHQYFHNGDEVAHCFARTGNVAHKVYPSNEVDIFHWIGAPWGKLFARRIIDKYSLSFQEQRTTNDVCFVFSALSVAKTIVECPEVFVAYREYAGSLTDTRHKSLHCFYDALVGYYDQMCALGIFPENERLLKNFYVYSCGQSFWQVDTIRGIEAVATMFPLLKDLCGRWHWCEVMDNDDCDQSLRCWCQALSQADDLWGFLRHYANLLRERSLRLAAIQRSPTYRLACKLSSWAHRLIGDAHA